MFIECSCRCVGANTRPSTSRTSAPISSPSPPWLSGSDQEPGDWIRRVRCAHARDDKRRPASAGDESCAPPAADEPVAPPAADESFALPAADEDHVLLAVVRAEVEPAVGRLDLEA